jgi:hypothetical protein
MSDEPTTWFHGDTSSEHSRPGERTDLPVAALGRLLRGVGAAVLLAAASTFLLQHWEAGNDLARYAGLLGLTALLSGAGFFTGIRLGETKGARTFLSLAAAVVPAHFCILGGLVYSQFAWGGALMPVPGYATWVAPSGTAALLTTVVAFALLAPTAFVSMLTLARSRAHLLTAAFLGVNALLLLPTRDPQLVSMMLAVTVVGLTALEVRVLRRDLALRTFEGVLVRMLLAAPPVLMALRSVLHYDLSAAFGFVVCAGASLLLFALSREERIDAALRSPLELATSVPAGGACLFAAIALEGAGIPEAAVLPAAALPFAGILGAISLATRGRPEPWRGAAVIAALSATALNLALFESAFAAFVCLAVSIGTLGFGFAARRRGLAVAGGAGALYALAHHVQAAIELYAWSSWGSLAALGVMVILAASLLERHHAVWAEQLAAWRRQLSGPER